MATHRRERSDSALASMQAATNKNVTWLNSAWTQLAYVAGIILFRGACFAFMPKVANHSALEWTVTNVVHGVVRTPCAPRSAPRARHGWKRTLGRRRRGAVSPLPPTSPRALQIAFFALHWSRGTPIWEDQGEHIEKTVWEQIDNGVPWTESRKFLMLVPVVVCVRAALPLLPVLC